MSVLRAAGGGFSKIIPASFRQYYFISFFVKVQDYPESWLSKGCRIRRS
jgi:hypothetical protein